jgi:hydroxypyruvate isomerase
MPRFAANLSLLYNDVDFLDRFAAAAADGFRGVEYLFPYAWPAEQLAGLLKAHGLQQVLFNAPRATGTPASAAWPAGPGARPSSAPASSRRWATPACWPARASM